MQNEWIILCILGYFALLYLISHWTGRKADNRTYFSANKSSPWFLVAFGMIGASLSGVTFISVPGWVATTQFSYMQMVLGYVIGYTVIAFLLMPLYYRQQLTSIYGYLAERFGTRAHKTGAAFFLLSRVVGASFRLFLVAIVFQLLLERMGVSLPFFVPVALSIVLIFLYTFRGGIKTVVWTDTLQTAFMLLAAALTIGWIVRDLNWGWSEAIQNIRQSPYSNIWVWDPSAPNHLIKHLVSGAFIAIVMTGLDQDMMQKNLTCRNIKEAQWNMMSFSGVLVFVNLAFLALGALLYLHGTQNGWINESTIDGHWRLSILDKASGQWMARGTDEIYPILAMDYLPPFVTILFVLGLVAAAYSSADSALTALTTSYCVDFLDIESRPDSEASKKRTRYQVQLGFSALIFVTIIAFQQINNQAVIGSIFKAAGYTYGPLLGLFAFGLFTRWKVRDRRVPIVCVISPIVIGVIDYLGPRHFGFSLGFLNLLLNGALTFAGLWLIRRREE